MYWGAQSQKWIAIIFQYQQIWRLHWKMVLIHFLLSLGCSIVANFCTCSFNTIVITVFANSAFGTPIDTHYARASTRGIDQYIAHCTSTRRSKKLHLSETKNVQFGIGKICKIGFAICSFPLESVLFCIQVFIANADIPLLLSLADMDRLAITYGNLNNIIIAQA